MNTAQQPRNELERALTSDSAAAPPSHILEGISDELAHHSTPGAPHTIYAELWHVTFWQQITLDWIKGIETRPESAAEGFPSETDIARESWADLCAQFFEGNKRAGDIAGGDGKPLDEPIRCPSPPGHPTRIMSVREQLESLAAHNAYHFGRIVLLRQLSKSWPPPSGGFTW